MGVVLGSVLQQGGLGRRYDDVVRAKPAWLSRARQAAVPRVLSLARRTRHVDRRAVPAFRPLVPDAHTVLIGPKTAQQVEDSVRAVEKGPLPRRRAQRGSTRSRRMVPFRPFEEPMILPLNRPREYYGPGMANVGAGVKVGKL